jgi:hypothetical protein
MTWSQPAHPPSCAHVLSARTAPGPRPPLPRQWSPLRCVRPAARVDSTHPDAHDALRFGRRAGGVSVVSMGSGPDELATAATAGTAAAAGDGRRGERRGLCVAVSPTSTPTSAERGRTGAGAGLAAPACSAGSAAAAAAAAVSMIRTRFMRSRRLDTVGSLDSRAGPWRHKVSAHGTAQRAARVPGSRGAAAPGWR